jgi:hypothetical protein
MLLQCHKRANRHCLFFLVKTVTVCILGAMDPRCEICIFMGKTDTSAARHQQQSMIAVPMNTPGVKVIRPLPALGFVDAPGQEISVDFFVSFCSR